MNSLHAERFLRLLYRDDIPEDTQLLIWSKNAKSGGVSHWFYNINALIKNLELGTLKKIRKTTDIYLSEGLALKRIDYGSYRRAKQAEVCGCAAISCDIDIAGPTHKRSAKSLFKDLDEAKNFIETLPWKPTITVFTGGGIQCWWVFEKPWVWIKDIDGLTDIDTEQQAKCLKLRKMWNKYLQNKSRRTIDSTYNLDRLLRLPGTYNCKITPIPVEIIGVNEIYYDPEYLFEELSKLVILDEPLELKQKPLVSFKIDDAPEPNWEKLDVILENDEQFVRTWNHDREDLEDQSQSSYDMAIAIALAQAGWTDQEIVNALIWNRLQYHPETAQKTKRTKYYHETLEKARLFIASMEISENKVTSTPKVENVNTNKKEQLLASARQFLKEKTLLPVKRIIMLGQDTNAEFTLELEDGTSFTLGDVNRLTDMKRWRNITVLYKDAQGLMPPVAPEIWAECCKFMKVLIENVDVAEPSQTATMKNYLRSYYEHTNPLNWYEMDEDQQYMTLLQNKPFRKGFDRTIHLTKKEPTPTHFVFNLNNLQRFIKNNLFDNMARKDIVNLIAKIGGIKKRVAAKNSDGLKCKRSVIAVPIKRLNVEEL